MVLLLAGVIALRFLAFSPLWLDESQSVAIAHRSLPRLFVALRRDGSPPLYYLLLHFWAQAAGTNAQAVRALSGVLSTATLPVMGWAVYRISGRRSWSWACVVLLASNPFAIRYATETRMYALVMLEVLLAVVAFHRVWQRPGRAPMAAAATVAAAGMLTHYWFLFLIAVAGLAASAAALRGSAPARRVVICLVAAGLPFLPWVPSFLFQSAHTGAPWAPPPPLSTVLWFPTGWAGDGLAGGALALGYYALATLAVAARRTDAGVVLGGPVRREALAPLAVGLAALTLGVAASEAAGQAYSGRYTAIGLPLFLLSAGAGFAVLRRERRAWAMALVALLGVAVASSYPTQLRSQAGQVARALSIASPGDLVIFCPDQLAPAVHRLVPRAGRQVVFPTFGPADMVNWIDYAKRNAVANPDVFAERAVARAGTGRSIFLVSANGYPTFGSDCAELYSTLSLIRGPGIVLLARNGNSYEQDQVALFPSR